MTWEMIQDANYDSVGLRWAEKLAGLTGNEDGSPCKVLLQGT